MQIYNIEHGEQLVKAARNSIELFLMNPRFDRKTVMDTLDGFERQHGIFVTLEHYPTRELRGCVGYPRAVAPIKESLIDSAIEAAFHDPRFVSVSERELDDLLVEVSILSSPVLITGSEKKRLEAVSVGRDGLIVQYGHYSGLLLPIVAVEQKWNKKEFLKETCIKAGLEPNYWSQPNVKLYKFETQVFREESPRGEVIEVAFNKQ